MNEWITAVEAARILDVDLTWVTEGLESGRVEGRKVDRGWEVKASTVGDILTEMTYDTFWLRMAVCDISFDQNFRMN